VSVPIAMKSGLITNASVRQIPTTSLEFVRHVFLDPQLLKILESVLVQMQTKCGLTLITANARLTPSMILEYVNYAS